MRFDNIVNLLLEEKKEEDSKEFMDQPWSIEIKKDPNGSKEYNMLGDLIIKLFEIRAKM
jgi:hypothetical protein